MEFNLNVLRNLELAPFQRLFLKEKELSRQQRHERIGGQAHGGLPSTRRACKLHNGHGAWEMMGFFWGGPRCHGGTP